MRVLTTLAVLCALWLRGANLHFACCTILADPPSLVFQSHNVPRLPLPCECWTPSVALCVHAVVRCALTAPCALCPVLCSVSSFLYIVRCVLCVLCCALYIACCVHCALHSAYCLGPCALASVSFLALCVAPADARNFACCATECLFGWRC